MAQERVRLGIIVPSANTILETDVQRLPVEGAQFHFTRILNSEDTPEQLAGMLEESGRAAWLLSHAGVKAIAFGCTGGSFLEGPGYDERVVDRMKEATGLHCLTASGCVVQALRKLNVHRVLLLTPYEEWLTRRAEFFLVGNGFDVVDAHWLSIADPHRMLAYDGPAITQWAQSKVVADADGIFISCTNFRALEAAQQLEEATGLTVVTSNQALIWGLLRAGGVAEKLDGYGRLLRS